MKWIIFTPRLFWYLLLAGFMGYMGYTFINLNTVGIDHYIMGGFALLLCFACVLMCVVTPVATVFSKDEVRLIYIRAGKDGRSGATFP